MRLVWVSPANIGPYHCAMFSAATSIIPGFSVLLIPKKTNFSHPWTSDINKNSFKTQVIQSKAELIEYMESYKPDIIFTVGYNHIRFLQSAYLGKKHDIPVFIVMDTWKDTVQRTWWKETIKSFIVRYLFNGAFVSGQRSYEYIKSLGIKESNIWRNLDIVDNNHFIEKNKWVSPSDFPNEFFLTVCRLIPEKNLDSLLKAFCKYRRSGGRWGLVIVGTGTLEHTLKNLLNPDIAGLVHWFGWAKYDELPALYQSSSCFILPSSSESWGLVVNEAMAAGLPILLSNKCGCAPELCKEGINGFSFDPFDVNRLTDLMLLMSSDKVDINAMGSESKNIIASYTPEHWAETILDISYKFIR